MQREMVGRRRRVGLFLVLGGVFLGFLLILAARGPLLEARAAMERGRDALLEGKTRDAVAAFEAARDHFSSAGFRLRNPLTRLASYAPILGRTPDAALAAAEAGEIVARAGIALASSVEDLPGGISALAPSGGSIPLEPVERLTPVLEEAASLLAEAEDRLGSVPTGLVLGPVAGPFAELEQQVADAVRTVTSGAELARALPVFLGGDGPRTYFVGAQNPAELRGTGGLIGAFAILTVDDGRLELGGFDTVGRLPNVRVGDIEPPSEDYARRYDRFGGAGFWLNINMTPDFPSAATAIERLWEQVGETPVDGTIVADPGALARLLGATGPAEVPGTGVTLDEHTLVPFVTNEAYAVLTRSRARKQLLGDVAGEVLGRFLSGTAAVDPADAGRALAEAAADGHLLLHAVDPTVQAAFESAGVSGGLMDPPGDYLAVVGNNAGGNKVDFYAQREVRYQVQLLPGGRAEATASVRLTNDAPSSGITDYVIGPFPGVSAAGENVTFLNVYCATRCQVQGVARGAGQAEGGIESELGHPVVWNEVRLPSGASEQLTYSWTIEDAWWRDGGTARYRLTFQGQPEIRPTALSVAVVPPSGLRIVSATNGVRIDEGVARWSGRTGDLMVMDVLLEEPDASALVRDVLPGPLL